MHMHVCVCRAHVCVPCACVLLDGKHLQTVLAVLAVCENTEAEIILRRKLWMLELEHLP